MTRRRERKREEREILLMRMGRREEEREREMEIGYENVLVFHQQKGSVFVLVVVFKVVRPYR